MLSKSLKYQFLQTYIKNTIKTFFLYLNISNKNKKKKLKHLKPNFKTFSKTQYFIFQKNIKKNNTIV